MPRDEVIDLVLGRRPLDNTMPTIPSLRELLGNAYTEDMETAFPDVVPPYMPCGKNIMVQLRTPGLFKRLPNGMKIWYTDETQEFMKHNVQTAIVRALGPVAYRHRLSMEPFIEGDWAVPGEFVRVPKFGGDRVAIQLPREGEEPQRAAYFLMVNDLDVNGRIYGDPLSVEGNL